MFSFKSGFSFTDRILTQPSFPELTLPPLEDIPYTDRGHFANPDKANLYAEVAAQGGSVKFHTPVLGVEFRGVSLKKLSEKALDDLALLIAEKGVVGESIRGVVRQVVDVCPHSVSKARRYVGRGPTRDRCLLGSA